MKTKVTVIGSVLILLSFCIYYRYNLVEDKGTWIRLQEDCPQDGYILHKSQIYGCYLDDLKDISRVTPMKDVDIATFEVCKGTGYARDKRKVYYPLLVYAVDGIDFGYSYFGEYVVKKDLLFGLITLDANPHHFKYIANGYAVDGHTMFIRGEEMKWDDKIIAEGEEVPDPVEPLSETTQDAEAVVIPSYSQDTTFNYSKAKRYQSFDEHSFIGIGKAKSSPFVYVINDKDTVYVKRSDLDIIFKYVRKDGYIHNRISIDMQKANLRPIKSADYSMARIYDRYILADSILELRYVFSGDDNSVTDCSMSLLVKDSQSCLNISIGDLCFRDVENPLNEIKHIISQYNSNGDNIGAKRYILKKDKSHYYYIYQVRTSPPPYTDNRRVLDSIVYKRGPLGLFGIEPGLDETNIK